MAEFSMTMVPSGARLAADFAGFGASMRSMREPLKECVQTVFSQSLQDNFAAQGRPDPWEPLADSTVAKKGFDTILTETGNLERVAGQLNIWTITGGYLSGHAEASIGGLPGAEYGFYHESGTSKMPAREFLVLQDEDVDKAMNIFSKFMSRRLRIAGFRVVG